MDRQAKSVALEKAHVHDVYEKIAPHFSDTRYKAWPRVKQFLLELDPGSLVADIGCGNGRYLPINGNVFKIGSDRCDQLVEIAGGNGHEVMVCDNIRLPYRDNCFDAVISIAVIHHFATVERRAQALKELARILRPGGKLMVYVWAMEQKQRKFDSQDVLVPWHLQPRYHKHKAKRLQDLKKENASYCSSTSDDDQQSEKNSRRAKPCRQNTSPQENGSLSRHSKLETAGRTGRCKKCGLAQRSSSDSGLLVNRYRQGIQQCDEDPTEKRTSLMAAASTWTSLTDDKGRVTTNGCSQTCDEFSEGVVILKSGNEAAESMVSVVNGCELAVVTTGEDVLCSDDPQKGAITNGFCNSSLPNEGSGAESSLQDGANDAAEGTVMITSGRRSVVSIERDNVCNGNTDSETSLESAIISGSSFSIDPGTDHEKSAAVDCIDDSETTQRDGALSGFCGMNDDVRKGDGGLGKSRLGARCSTASESTVDSAISITDSSGSFEASQSVVAAHFSEGQLCRRGRVCEVKTDGADPAVVERRSSVGELIISGVRKLVNGISGEKSNVVEGSSLQAELNADDSWVLVEAEHRKIGEKGLAIDTNSPEMTSSGLAEKSVEQCEIVRTKLSNGNRKENLKDVDVCSGCRHKNRQCEGSDGSVTVIKKHSFCCDNKEQSPKNLPHRNSDTKLAACSDCSDNSTDSDSVSLRKCKSEGWLLNFSSKFSPKLLRLRAGRTTPPIAEISQAVAKGETFRPRRFTASKKSLVISEDACSTSSVDSESDLSGNFSDKKTTSPARQCRRTTGDSIEVDLCSCGGEPEEGGLVGAMATRSQQTALGPDSRTDNGDSTEDPSTFKRYYHVFKEGELVSLIEEQVESLYVLQSYYDHANWCVVAEKVQVWKI